MSTTQATTPDAQALRNGVAQTRRWVVKIGSALATNQGVGLNLAAIEGWNCSSCTDVSERGLSASLDRQFVSHHAKGFPVSCTIALFYDFW